MDIHPPHPVHSWKDFGVQLVTITAGILIALSLEGVRESIHDRALVREARENIHREVADNKRELDDEIATMPGRAKKLDAALRSQHRRALDVLGAAIGLVTAADDGNPTNAAPADIQRFRDQVLSLRSILLIEEQLTHSASERYKKALE